MIGARRGASPKPEVGADGIPARLLGACILALRSELACVLDTVLPGALNLRSPHRIALSLTAAKAGSSPLQYSRPFSTHPNLSYKAVSVH
jgi:hypothetical protein